MNKPISFAQALEDLKAAPIDAALSAFNNLILRNLNADLVAKVYFDQVRSYLCDTNLASMTIARAATRFGATGWDVALYDEHAVFSQSTKKGKR